MHARFGGATEAQHIAEHVQHIDINTIRRRAVSGDLAARR